MLQSALDHIKENILTSNPKTFSKGYAGARQYQDGKIVIYDNSEGEYVGLKDTDYNYFYIRYLDEIDIDIAPEGERSSSCDELQGVATLRLVAWVNNGDLGKLTEALLHDIMATDFETMSASAKERFSDLKFLFNNIQFDPEQIYKDETGNTDNEEVKLKKGVTLMAIDFGITFNYQLKSDACIDRDICMGCA